MQIFELDDKVSVVCNYQSNRSGFTHKAVLYDNGIPVYESTAHYTNRTWERFTFESVLRSVVDQAINTDQSSYERYGKYKKIIQAM